MFIGLKCVEMVASEARKWQCWPTRSIALDPGLFLSGTRCQMTRLPSFSVLGSSSCVGGSNWCTGSASRWPMELHDPACPRVVSESSTTAATGSQSLAGSRGQAHKCCPPENVCACYLMHLLDDRIHHGALRRTRLGTIAASTARTKTVSSRVIHIPLFQLQDSTQIDAAQLRRLAWLCR